MTTVRALVPSGTQLNQAVSPRVAGMVSLNIGISRKERERERERHTHTQIKGFLNHTDTHTHTKPEAVGRAANGLL
jgi:hypothetical protein